MLRGVEMDKQTNSKIWACRATPSCFACFTNASIVSKNGISQIVVYVIRITADCRIPELVMCAPKGSVYNAVGR